MIREWHRPDGAGTIPRIMTLRPLFRLPLAAAAAELWRREGSNPNASGAPASRWRLAGVAEAHRDRI